ncbi:hypothetical protein PIB30_090128 [Stylosanthes scabra]|uniref:Uncharacterized protein n=1 Tax=Stylosanthes scabra TaxID=79078 RepID=A0ABU6VTZ9_9FABA|nr:hypothetical protein [Stylosanthes scabra]
MEAVATTLQIHEGLYDKEGDGKFPMMFWLADFKCTLILDQLSSILGLENSGTLFKGGGKVPKNFESFSIGRAKQSLQVSSISGGKYSVGTMSTDHRLLHYMLSYVWLPRRVNTGLGHEMLWTKIFEHFGIDLSSEEAIFVDDGSAITSRHLNKMGRGPKAAVEENVDADEEGPHPQGVSSSAHFPPELMEAFTQGIQSFHSSWRENVQGMDRRLDGYESRLSNCAKEIQELGNDVHRFFSRAAQSEDQGFQDSAPDQD